MNGEVGERETAELNDPAPCSTVSGPSGVLGRRGKSMDCDIWASSEVLESGGI